MEQKYNIAGYCRISVDEEMDRENTSIENQKSIIEDFVKRKFPGSTMDFYEDRDRSGYMGLYGGMTVSDIHRKKGLKDKEKILDFMGSTELIANLFRISQTEEKLKMDDASSAEQANNIHYEVAEKIRKAMIEMGTTLPENLPTPEKSIQVIEREEIRKLRDSKQKLMLDE